MAYAQIINGQLRQVFRETIPQGNVTQTVLTGIRIAASQLTRVRGQLTIDSVTGAPSVTATASVSAGGFLQIAVTNSVGGTDFTWTLDVQLTHSNQQARDLNLAHGPYIAVVNGTVAVGSGSADIRTVVLAADFYTLDGNMADVTGMSIPVVAGREYLVKVHAVVAQAAGVRLTLAGSATSTSALLTHSIVQHGVVGAVPAMTPLLQASKGSLGDAQYTECPFPGSSPALALWLIEGYLKVNAGGDLRLRWQLVGAPSYHNTTLMVAGSTLRTERIPVA